MPIRLPLHVDLLFVECGVIYPRAAAGTPGGLTGLAASSLRLKDDCVGSALRTGVSSTTRTEVAD